MNAVTLVLILFAVVGLALFALGLVLFAGSRADLRAMRELERTGVEVPAVLVSLTPWKTYLSAVYEYPAADGSPARHTASVGRNPLNAVGESHPMTRTAHPSENVRMGTIAEVRHERTELERHLRFLTYAILASAATCAVAVTGLALRP
ncbi:hypothetical protein ACWD4X_05940 [Streptomyces termitum]